MAQPDSPTPATVSDSSAPTRIRRNVACVRCRDAKVKCNASVNPGQPCVRCSKLNLPCVVDKSHKRTTKRSKLEELAAEVRTIKEAVSPRSRSDTLLEGSSVAVPQLPTSRLDLYARLPSNPIASALPSSSSASEPAVSGDLPALTPQSYTTPSASAGLPTQPRALGSRVFSAEDIDYYFTRFFEHFHPHLPIVRTRNPDECYKSAPVLFWAILTVTCRRYGKGDGVFQFLVEKIPSEIWAAVAQPPLRPPTINAILLIATWPLPTIRFMSDPSHIFASIALNSCYTIGLHTGRGAHPEFNAPLYNIQTTDEEATYTWAASNIIYQRVSSYLGCPSTTPVFGKALDSVLDGTGHCSVPRSFVVHLETARFSSRLSRTAIACLEDTPGISHHVVSQMEEEFIKLNRLLYPDNPDVDNFTMLMTLLDLQLLYLMPLPGFSDETLKRNVIKCYNTAENLVRLALKLEREAGFLTHAPHFVFRALLAASCVCISFFLSPTGRSIGVEAGESLIDEVIVAMRTCSVQEGDLAGRATNMMERYWSVRHHFSNTDVWKLGLSSFTHRLGASLVFDCIRKWKTEVEHVRSSGPAGPSGQDVALPPPGAMTGPYNPGLGAADSLQRIDWNAFMEDFDWSFTSNYLNVP
ncbi:hypothetical protein VTK73DRAFT_901 [Phialemonium thermophilum]|uniref:Zn(2)-C6 fungal-type domain-containing protein n=1 Tax=Phialemonium thermophilum TaxID=223376 RepID=A0ABR3Y4F0_9PEZI